MIVVKGGGSETLFFLSKDSVNIAMGVLWSKPIFTFKKILVSVAMSLFMFAQTPF